MPSGHATSRFTVDLDALSSNYETLRALSAGAEVAGLLKANAYGLGAAHVAPRLWECGARSFFTAGVAGADAIRALLPGSDVYVLDGCRAGDGPHLVEAGLIPVLNSLEQVEHWRAAAPGRPAALHVDTGMNRLGIRVEEAKAVARSELPVSLIMSHLACGDDPESPMSRRQLEAFRQVRALFPDARASLANSGGIFQGPEFAFDLTRPGCSMYGGGPFGRPDDRIAPVATLEAEILQVRRVPKGESVGYAASYTAPRDMVVATVGAGYADGVLRSYQPRAQVWFEGGLWNVVGRISMDTLAVDVTDCPGAKPGAFVELFGRNRMLDDAAAAAGTISYELLTSIGTRVERMLRGNGA